MKDLRRLKRSTIPIEYFPAFIFICSIALSGCGSRAAASSAQRGKELFNNCAPCHGPAGEGRREVGAPAIGGRQAWYIEEELQEFRSGVRGAHFDDEGGLRMRPMVKTLTSETDMNAVAQYVASLPSQKHPATVDGDASAGHTLYDGCAACHGDGGAGNPDLKAAPIAGVEDWYLVSELRKFKRGVRGYNPDDAQGNMMKSASDSLADDRDIRNVAAYIRTLQK